MKTLGLKPMSVEDHGFAQRWGGYKGKRPSPRTMAEEVSRQSDPPDKCDTGADGF